MKISLDKAFIWLIPYLYFVSIAFYSGFWGTFGIDAFNYYAVSDLIKGIPFPLSISLLLSLALAILVFVIEFFTHKQRSKLTVWVVLASLAILLATLLYIYFSYFFRTHSQYVYIRISREVTGPILMGASFLIAAAVVSQRNLSRANKAYLQYSIYAGTILFITLLPTMAFSSGRDAASYALENREFNYVVADSLATPKKCIYKYLGKAGDYHMLLSMDNTKQVIIAADKLAPLVIENYSIGDSAKRRAFLKRKKEACACPLPIKQNW